MNPPDCPFCNYAGPSEIIYWGRFAFVIEPLNPVCEGHLLVIPNRHVADFAESPFLTAEVVRVAARWATDGRDWNLIASKGSAATQTVDHLHFHLIPRREGDGLKLPWTDQGATEGLPDDLVSTLRDRSIIVPRVRGASGA